MGFTWPLWDLPGHYGSAIIGCASHIVTCQIPLKIIKETNIPGYGDLINR